MTKRRRLLVSRDNTYVSPLRGKAKAASSSTPPKLVRAARGRLMGALLEVLDGDSSNEDEVVQTKRSRKRSQTESEDEEDPEEAVRRQSYVLKLFDRSVDLSQFHDDSPLYPICRAWMINQPKANYASLGTPPPLPPKSEDSVPLPGPEGPPEPRAPPPLPDQLLSNKDNINLNYREAPPPPAEQLLVAHAQRWSRVRRAWLAHGARRESRYAGSQRVLNQLNMG